MALLPGGLQVCPQPLDPPLQHLSVHREGREHWQRAEWVQVPTDIPAKETEESLKNIYCRNHKTCVNQKG